MKLVLIMLISAVSFGQVSYQASESSENSSKFKKVKTKKTWKPGFICEGVIENNLIRLSANGKIQTFNLSTGEAPTQVKIVDTFNDVQLNDGPQSCTDYANAGFYSVRYLKKTKKVTNRPLEGRLEYAAYFTDYLGGAEDKQKFLVKVNSAVVEDRVSSKVLHASGENRNGSKCNREYRTSIKDGAGKVDLGIEQISLNDLSYVTRVGCPKKVSVQDIYMSEDANAVVVVLNLKYRKGNEIVLQAFNVENLATALEPIIFR